MNYTRLNCLSAWKMNFCCKITCHFRMKWNNRIFVKSNLNIKCSALKVVLRHRSKIASLVSRKLLQFFYRHYKLKSFTETYLQTFTVFFFLRKIINKYWTCQFVFYISNENIFRSCVSLVECESSDFVFIYFDIVYAIWWKLERYKRTFSTLYHIRFSHTKNEQYAG